MKNITKEVRSLRIVKMTLSILIMMIFLVSLFCRQGVSSASYPTTPIVFSNIRDKSGDYPVVCYSTTKNGYNVNGHIYVKFQDLASPLGGTYTIAPGPTYVLQINGQTNAFYMSSTTFYSTISYSILDKNTGQTTQYSFNFPGTQPYPVMTIDGYPCVWVQYAARALGSLIADWDGSNNRFVIYDWRVNGNNHLSDTNTYLVGGKWLSNWDSNSTSTLYLAPHFQLGIDNIWSNPSSHPDYDRQVKIATTVLQSMENTRKLMGNTPYSPSCVFRSYWYNKSLSGSWIWSWHMKGRAMDAGDSAMYTAVNNDILGAPKCSEGFRSSTNSNSVSQWDEIEDSSIQINGPWLHGQRLPKGCGSNSNPVPYCP
ncbi:MAG: hypothetical protein COS15_01310 [Caldiserica bacterium CG02_land_8_20_14_3_00_36_38]|nr:MAG: hypothetical protein COS15_01310 [Caldiserica bacterium CG02_land_8_20_14_3_00_36_38]